MNIIICLIYLKMQECFDVSLTHSLVNMFGVYGVFVVKINKN